MRGGDGTMRERKKKKEAEENEEGDKKNRVLEWGSNPVRSDCRVAYQLGHGGTADTGRVGSAGDY